MKKILIIDDDPHHLALCKLLVRHNFTGIDTLELTRIEDAYNLIIMERPICIILDNMMPGGSGMVLLHNLKENMKKVPPIIFLSCAMTESLALNAGALGAAICMSKSHAMNGEIIRAIEQLTGEKSNG